MSAKAIAKAQKHHAKNCACGETFPKPSTDFNQSREEWEMAVFRDAVGFTVCYHSRQPRQDPDYHRQDFKLKEFPKALEAAKQPTPNGKPRLLYAITAAGRQLCLDRAERDNWLKLWKEIHKCQV